MRRLRLRSSLAALLLTILATATPAPASADVTCHKRDLRTGSCLIHTTAPAKGAGAPAPPTRPVGDRSNGPTACTLERETVPCRHQGGTWSNSHHCYLKRMQVQPPKSDPAWQGHPTGAVYHCFLLDENDAYPVWLAAAPGAAPPPDPRVLAGQAIRSMQLKAIRIGIVPEPRRDHIGLVGLPVWIWTANPGATTWGPITRTAAARGYTVTATGHVDRIVWAMGDGEVVVCRTPGTPYEDRYGNQSSPDCGYRYSKQGVYTVRATSYWMVKWRGVGERGDILLNFTQAAIITVGEAQVLVTGAIR